MRWGIGSTNRTKTPYHTNPSWLTADSWKPDVSNFSKLKPKEELTWHQLHQPPLVTPPYMQMFNPVQNNPAVDVDIPILRSCPAFNHECYNCYSTGHFTALCRRPHIGRQLTTPNKCRESRERSHRSGSHRRSSKSPRRGRQRHRSNSHNSGYMSSSHSPSQDHNRRRSPRYGRCSPTPYRHQVSHIMSFNSNNEGQLYTDKSPDGQRSFHTMLQLVTKQGCKSLLVKVDTGANVNTIPLSHYRTPIILHHKLTWKWTLLEAPQALGPHTMDIYNNSWDTSQ